MTSRSDSPLHSVVNGSNMKSNRGGSVSPLRGVVDISHASALKQRAITNVTQSFSASLSLSGETKCDTIPSATLYLDTTSPDIISPDASDNNLSPLWRREMYSESYTSASLSFKESSSKSKTDTIPDATPIDDSRSPSRQANLAKGQKNNLKSFFSQLSTSVKISHELEPMPMPNIHGVNAMGSPKVHSPKRRGSNSLIQHMHSAQGSIIRDSQKNDEYGLVAIDSPLYPSHKNENVHHAKEEKKETPPESFLEVSAGGDRDDDGDDDDHIRLGESIKTTSYYKISLIIDSHPRKALAALMFIIACLVLITVSLTEFDQINPLHIPCNPFANLPLLLLCSPY